MHRLLGAGGRGAGPQDINRVLNEWATELLSRFDALEELSKITCPTLVCVGDDRPRRAIETAKAWARGEVSVLPPNIGMDLMCSSQAGYVQRYVAR